MTAPVSIFVLEDDAAWGLQIETMLLKLGFNVPMVATNTASIIAQLPNIHFDLALLDISVDGQIVGIELAKIIQAQYKKPVVFLTANKETQIAIKANSLPNGLLLYKPVEEKILFNTIQLAIAQSVSPDYPPTNTQREEYIFVKVGQKYKKLLWKQVELLEIDGKYTSIKLQQDATKYYIRSSLQKMMQIIIPLSFQASFIQINRNQILNSHFIEEINGNILLSNGNRYEFSENYLPQIKAKLNIVR
jgi:DNA-binding LytR/AlgR family response regulator